MAMHGAPILAGVWVFIDALQRRVPRPLRWALGTMLLLAIILPWYLARRKKPQSSVPFVEGEVGPVTRFVLIALLLFFLISLIFYVVQGPPPALAPPPPSKGHQSGVNSVAGINNFRPWKGCGRRMKLDEGLFPLAGASSAQAETNAPSDARQM
jgi:membrane protease YdiL (CAAX protease family)